MDAILELKERLEKQRIAAEETLKKTKTEADIARAKAEVEEELRKKDEEEKLKRENDIKHQLAELREEIMEKFIEIEKNYLQESKNQTMTRIKVTEETHNTCTHDLKNDISKIVADTEIALLLRQKKKAEMEETDMYYFKATDLIKDILRIAVRAEEYIISDEDTRAQAKKSINPLAAMVPVQDKAYANLMETHVSKQYAEMHLVKHQKLAGKQSDGQPPISAMSDLFERKKDVLAHKIDVLNIEYGDAPDDFQREVAHAKISMCDEIRKTEEKKHLDLCELLISIFKKSQDEIDAVLKTEEEIKRKAEREAREREKRDQEERDRKEQQRIERERLEQEQKEREAKEREREEVEREAKERVVRAQKAAEERRRLQSLSLLCYLSIMAK